jgi:hypothetical protein
VKDGLKIAAMPSKRSLDNDFLRPVRAIILHRGPAGRLADR